MCIRDRLNIVKYFFHLDFDENDVYFFRFITHLKFFAKRIAERSGYDDSDSNDLLDVIKGKYGDAFRCVEKITQFIRKKYGYQLSGEEQLYLTIHINRIITKVGVQSGNKPDAEGAGNHNACQDGDT